MIVDGRTVPFSVWKFPLHEAQWSTCDMPSGAKILTVQFQEGVGPCLWAAVDPKQPKETRRFYVVGTGSSVDVGPLTYIGTFQVAGTFLGVLVFHVFELVAGAAQER